MIFRILLGIILVAYCPNVFAQNPKVEQIKMSAQKIEDIVTAEKARLDSTIADINNRLEKGLISTEEANEESRAIAEEVSENIIDVVNDIQDDIVDNIQSLVDEILETTNSIQESTYNGEDEGEDEEDEDNHRGYKDADEEEDEDWHSDMDWKDNIKKGLKKKHRSEKRVTDQTVFGFGFSSLLQENQVNTLNDSPLDLFGSRYWEIGYTQKARLTANSSAVSFKYGLSLMIHNMNLNENQIFVKNGDKTDFVDFDYELDKAKLRTTYLALPVHLEFDFSPSKKTDDGDYIVRSQRSVRLGVGGFIGLPIRSKQVLEYRAGNLKIEESQKGNFNVTQFAYGLSAYLGYKDFSFYSKMDLNSFFKNNTPDMSVFTFGVRWDWN